MGGAPMGGAPMGGAPMGGAAPPIEGQEPRENTPPTAEETSRLDTLKKLREKLILDDRNGEITKVTRMIIREENKNNNI